MKFGSKVLVFAIFALAVFALTGCSGPASATYQNASISLTYNPTCNGCASNYAVNPPGAGGITGTATCVSGVCSTSGAIEMPGGGGTGGCIELQATVTNAAANPSWTIIPSPVVTTAGNTSATSNVGTISSASGLTNYYCEASGSGAANPIYSGAQLAQAQAAGLPQGTTEVIVSNPIDPNNPAKVVSAAMFFAYQASTLPSGATVGINQAPSVTIPLTTQYQFTGYVVGVSGYILQSGTTAPVGGCVAPVAGVCVPAPTLDWSVTACTATGVTGAPALVIANGTSNYGSINSAGLYTAPAVYPASTAKCANITAKSAAYNDNIGSTVTTVYFQ